MDATFVHYIVRKSTTKHKDSPLFLFCLFLYLWFGISTSTQCEYKQRHVSLLISFFITTVFLFVLGSIDWWYSFCSFLFLPFFIDWIILYVFFCFLSWNTIQLFILLWWSILLNLIIKLVASFNSLLKLIHLVIQPYWY